jgi:hypothetical protein
MVQKRIKKEKVGGRSHFFYIAGIYFHVLLGGAFVKEIILSYRNKETRAVQREGYLRGQYDGGRNGKNTFYRGNGQKALKGRKKRPDSMQGLPP